MKFHGIRLLNLYFISLAVTVLDGVFVVDTGMLTVFELQIEDRKLFAFNMVSVTYLFFVILQELLVVLLNWYLTITSHLGLDNKIFYNSSKIYWNRKYTDEK